MREISGILISVLVGGILGYMILKEIGMVIGIAVGYYLGSRFIR